MSLKFSSKNTNTPVLVIAISVAISVLINVALIKSLGASTGDKQIADYIENNPTVIVESVNKYYEKQAANVGKDRSKNLAENRKEVFNSKKDPVLGDKSSSKVVVEFFDYNCGYCKKAYKTVTKVSAAHPDIKFILKEMPILGPSSDAKARVSMAANLLDKKKYAKVHAAIMASSGAAGTVEKVADIVAPLGFSRDKLIKKANSPEVVDTLEANKSLARTLGINGTPAFIIGEEFVDGALPYDAFIEKVKKLK